jgi:quinol monooxygenase YgiN
MKRYVIAVDFSLHPGVAEQFMPLMLDNAEKSRTLEPGCDRFDVCVPAGERDRVYLYEIYKDEAAFARARRPHFLRRCHQDDDQGRKVGKLRIERRREVDRGRADASDRPRRYPRRAHPARSV